MTTDTVAFDIDGVLTTKEGKLRFQEEKKRANNIGIVTARSDESAREFIERNNLSVDFVKSTPFKGMALEEIADTGLYIGSGPRDRLHARVAGWSFHKI